jgi:glycerol-3-phosphate acyltransferase PlsX
MDVGATLHVESQDLYNFALMGSLYASIVSSNDSPSIALLSNGTEATKGPTEVVEAHARLNKNPHGLNFIGNVEGLDIPRGSADVIVCEGYLGNVVLKLLEGVTELAADLAKEAYDSKLIWKLGLTMLSKDLQKLRKLTDWKQYGGAPILGFDKVVIKAHGRSNARAIRNAIKLASKVHEGRLIEQIQSQMEST